MQRAPALTLSLFVLLACGIAACSGNAIVEPGAKTSKRAKLFLSKCEPPLPPADVGELEEVYACLPAEDACPEASDPVTAEELGYALEKSGDGCGTSVLVYDVPCGPDLNAIDCCYAVRLQTSTTICE